jgi:release factor glutamine methyltransferase
MAALTAACKGEAGFEARLLLQAATGLPPLTFMARAEDIILDPEAAAYLQACAARRLAGEPLSRILGRSGFYGLDLHVVPDVLDPRSDTETLVNAALALLRVRNVARPRILDLGVGSGAILCALLDALPDAFGVGVDISAPACRLARLNLADCGLARRSAVVRGDWAAAINGPFDLVVSNPPYISHREMGNLEREVVTFDPILALDGGVDGLDCYRRIADHLPRLADSGGIVCFEIGWTQGIAVAEILKAVGAGETRIYRDIANRERVVALERF